MEHHDTYDESGLGAQDDDKQYTAASGKDRFDHCRGKSLIYQTSDTRPTTPIKHGKKGAPGGMSAAQAPYATMAELGSNGAKAPHLAAAPSLEHKSSLDSTSDVNAAQNGAQGFDPAVYAANRAANVKLKEESALRNFVGNGNILSHPANAAAAGNVHTH